MAKSNRTNWLRRQWGIIVLLLFIAIQHGLWLFGSVYKDLGSVLGGGGDAYYNLALFMQNALNFYQGHFYSLHGDHLSFYSMVMGVTEHVKGPSLVFAVLYPILRNPVAIFNVLYFGNLILLQVGMYYLIRHYTRNTWLAIVAALFVVLSTSLVADTYVAHIHVMLYWALPFLILFLELYLRPGTLSRRRMLWLPVGIALTSGWLWFAEWHILLFSALWLGVWIVAQLPRLWRERRELWRRVSMVVGIFAVWTIALLPLAYGYLQASHTFNTVRSLGDVVGTNFHTDAFFGIGRVVRIAISVAAGIAPHHAWLQYLNGLTDHLAQGQGFPDPLFTISFWVGFFVLIPWVVALIVTRGRFYARSFMYLCIFLLSAVVMLGPVLNIGGGQQESVVLPYYFLYKAIYPLSAIRAVWRAGIVGYLALLVFWALMIDHAWRLVIVPRLKAEHVPQSWKIVGGIYVAVGMLFLGLIQNKGFVGGAVPVAQPSDVVQQTLEQLPITQEPTAIFFWGPHVDEAAYNYFVSNYNLKHNERRVVLALGGVAGTYPRDTVVVHDLVTQNRQPELAAQVLAAKRVAVIFEEVAGPSAASALSPYYEPGAADREFRVWHLKNTPQNVAQQEERIFFVTLSRYQKANADWQLILNSENPTDKIMVTAEPVAAHRFTFELRQKDQLVTSRKLQIGEQAVLLPHTGFGVPVAIAGAGTPGDLTIRVLRDDVPVATAAVRVLSAGDYADKLAQAQKEAIAIVPHFGPRTTINLQQQLVPTKMTLDIAQGVVANEHQAKILTPNHPVIAAYANESGEKYNGFPGWLVQPICPLRGNYFAEETLTFWCNQYQPFDDRFVQVTAQVDAQR